MILYTSPGTVSSLINGSLKLHMSACVSMSMSMFMFHVKTDLKPRTATSLVIIYCHLKCVRVRL